MTIKLPSMRGQQWRQEVVAANDGSIAMTIQSPLMRRAKIKIKNKKAISSDHKAAVNDPSSMATLRSHC
jgi:hypothetical protein